MEPTSSILVIDHDEATLQLIQDILAPEYEVCTAKDPQQAIDLLMRKHFNLLIVDLFFPSLHGLDLIRTVRAISKLTQMPILAVSASDKLKEVRLEDTPMILAKPFALDDLSRMVSLAMHSSKPNRMVARPSHPLQQKGAGYANHAHHAPS